MRFLLLTATNGRTIVTEIDSTFIEMTLSSAIHNLILPIYNLISAVYNLILAIYNLKWATYNLIWATYNLIWAIHALLMSPTSPPSNRTNEHSRRRELAGRPTPDRAPGPAPALVGPNPLRR